MLFGVRPWNFPYYQLARFAAPNAMAGNVMIKHASSVSRSALACEDHYREAGPGRGGGRARANGAGPPVPDAGAFIRPTILTGVTRDNPVYGHEFRSARRRALSTTGPERYQG